MDIPEDVFKVIIRPGSKKNEVLGFDKERGAYRIAIKEKPEKNKANKELIRFLSGMKGKPVSIFSGMTSKVKHIRAVKE